PVIMAAAQQWNKAFEPLGFINAVQIFEQSDTASWDAGDIRYNVLRWTSSPTPPFGGYGPSFVNPRTGEILGADIMLEYIFVTNRVHAEKLYESNSADHYCEAGNNLHNEMLMGMQMLRAAGASEIEMTKLIQQSLFYLVLHEMGHTLGLQHNMKASNLLSPEQLKNVAETDKNGVIGSVMDYPAINFNRVENQSVQYCQTAPGPYDLWAIEYGYSIAENDAEKETERLNKILSRSGEAVLTFGNDADDMRSPGKGIDPRVMINDLSSDAIQYGIDRIELIKKTMPGLMNKFGKEGESYQEITSNMSSLLSGYSGMLGIVSRYVGGVYVERVAPGSPNAKQPLTPVAYADQKRAMKMLAKYAFAPDAMDVPDALIPYLQKQRRGYNFFASTEDPKLHDMVENAQMGVLDHLLSKSVLLRLTDSREYGNQYSVGEMMNDLTIACFNEDLAGNVNSHRQILQINYVNYLIQIAGFKKPSTYDNIAMARATTQLLDIQRKLKAVTTGDKDTRDHRAYINQLIENAFKE
ncbi:MAG: zinc-dependent metalloprotease, partial [Bacteroidetes bacterium]|nr:zinc-dependent metalloprotease [Bacteroidota bacterium]